MSRKKIHKRQVSETKMSKFQAFTSKAKEIGTVIVKTPICGVVVAKEFVSHLPSHIKAKVAGFKESREVAKLMADAVDNVADQLREQADKNDLLAMASQLRTSAKQLESIAKAM